MTDANSVAFPYELCVWTFSRSSTTTASHPELGRIGSVRHTGRDRSTRFARSSHRVSYLLRGEHGRHRVEGGAVGKGKQIVTRLELELR